MNADLSVYPHMHMFTLSLAHSLSLSFSGYSSEVRPDTVQLRKMVLSQGPVGGPLSDPLTTSKPVSKSDGTYIPLVLYLQTRNILAQSGSRTDYSPRGRGRLFP
jgi:hypothetical protein